ncbi:MAG: OmpH family outer membrane protein [Armatimonadetes bacterium]|nr:OmpH family outer membrane protein [Candidatus Hippobium faecium]
MKKLLLILTLTLLSYAAMAQSVAVIDMSVIGKSDYVTNSTKELEAQYIKSQTELKIRQDCRFLGENEITELINLVVSKGDEAKIKEFQNTNDKRYDELQTLNQTKELTDEQKTRLQELNNITKKSGENFENRQNALADSFNALQEKKDAEIFDAIKTACEKVAKEKNYSIVIEKNSVFFGGDDITKDVIAALPKAN